MRRNIFTSYIICNRLNLKTFLKPIIYFIEIGNPIELPLWEPYMRISSRTAQAETHKYWFQRIYNRKFKTSLSAWFDLPRRYEVTKIRNLFFVMIMPKNIKLAHLSFFMLIVTGLLNLLFPIFYLLFDLLFFFCAYCGFTLVLLLIGILLLRPYESIETSDSY